MAELFCLETDRTLVSRLDNVLLNDTRVLDNLLSQEQLRVPRTDYFYTVQSEVTPARRKIVATWMLEVCEEQRCENAVFPMAMNYLDRFLSSTNVQIKHLQLLGGVCLLMASKFRQTLAVTIENIVHYTDFSVSREEVLNWELLVLSKLKWDISATIADDFMDHLLHRLNIQGKDAQKVRKHAAIFSSLCSSESHFMEFSPSVLASACIAASAHGLSSQIHRNWSDLSDLLQKLQHTTQRPMESIVRCYEKVEELLLQNTNPSEDSHKKNPCTERSPGVTATNKSAQVEELGNDFSPQQPETPTDVQDISF